PCMPFVQIGPKGTSALSASPTEVFFLFKDSAMMLGLAKCPSTGCPPAPALPTRIAMGAFGASVPFQGLVYLLHTRRAELPEGNIEACTPTDCNGGRPKVFVNGRVGP